QLTEAAKVTEGIRPHSITTFAKSTNVGIYNSTGTDTTYTFFDIGPFGPQEFDHPVVGRTVTSTNGSVPTGGKAPVGPAIKQMDLAAGQYPFIYKMVLSAETIGDATA